MINDMDGLSKTIRRLLYLVLLVPITVLPGFFQPYTTARGVLLRAVTDIAFALLLGMILLHTWRRSNRRDPILWALVSLVIANFLSAFFGVYFARSLFGDLERMWGVWTWLHLCVLYILLRVYFRQSDWLKFLHGILLVCMVTCIYAFIQSYRGVIQTPSTIGNSGLYAGYLLLNLGLALYLWVEDGIGRLKYAYGVASAVILVALLVAANRSVFLGIFAGIIWALVFQFYRSTPRMRLIIGISIALLSAGIGCLMYIYGPSIRQVPNANVPSIVKRLSHSGIYSPDTKLRELQWKSAIEGFKDRPLLGYGPENNHIVWSLNTDPYVYKISNEGKWDRVHNAYLEALSGTGIVGFVCLIIFFSSLVYVVIRSYASVNLSQGQFTIVIGLFVGYGVYLFFWFFDINSAMLLIILGAHISFRFYREPLLVFSERQIASWKSKMGTVLIGSVLLISLYVQGYEPLRISYKLNAILSGRYSAESQLVAFQSVFNSPAPQGRYYLNIYSDFINSITSEVLPVTRHDAYPNSFIAQSLDFGMRQSDKEIARDPSNDLLYMEKSYLLMKAGDLYKNPVLYADARKFLDSAIRISPNKIALYLMASDIDMAAGNLNEARKNLAKAYFLHPQSPETHYQFAKLEFKAGNIDLAEKWLRSSLSLKYVGPPSLVLSIGFAMGMENKARERALYLDYLKRLYPSLATSWKITTTEMPSDEIKEMLRRMGRSIRPTS